MSRYVVERFEHAGMLVEIEHDQESECPWDAMEGLAPLVAQRGFRGGFDDRSDGKILAFFDQVEPFRVEASWRKIADAFGMPQTDCMREVVKLTSQDRMSIPQALMQLFADELGGQIEAAREEDGWKRSEELFDTLHAIYQAIGIPSLRKSLHGHVQGEMAVMLLVALPDWCEATGAPFGDDEDRDAEDLNGCANRYGWWAYGSTYQISVSDPESRISPKFLSGFAGGEGEVGSDWDYMIEQAKELAEEMAGAEVVAMTAQSLPVRKAA